MKNICIYGPIKKKNPLMYIPKHFINPNHYYGYVLFENGAINYKLQLCQISDFILGCVE